MRRFLLLAVALLIGSMLFFGCEEEPTSPIEPPRNLTITANPDGLTLTVSWTKSLTEDEEDGIDGYYIYFNGILENDVEEGVYQYQFSPDELGTIEVTAYRDDEESIFASVTTETVDRNNITLADWDSSDESSIGWDRLSGIHTLYSTLSENADYIDVIWDSRDQTLNSPDQILATGGHETWFAEDDGTGEAPGSGSWINIIDMVVGQSYYVELYDGYYLLLTVDSESEGAITISYNFQKIQGYKRVY
ncbi:hypothetical protein DRQ33_02450 [bacterium]|nr:MAG: hypothetical protein DRQ33_02450 [bacterium]